MQKGDLLVLPQLDSYTWTTEKILEGNLSWLSKRFVPNSKNQCRTGKKKMAWVWIFPLNLSFFFLEKDFLIWCFSSLISQLLYWYWNIEIQPFEYHFLIKESSFQRYLGIFLVPEHKSKFNNISKTAKN